MNCSILTSLHYHNEIVLQWQNVAIIFIVLSLAYKSAIKKLPVIPPNHGLKLRALVGFEDANGKRTAGDEWQLEGPLTYYPKPEAVSVVLHVSNALVVTS